MPKETAPASSVGAETNQAQSTSSEGDTPTKSAGNTEVTDVPEEDIQDFKATFLSHGKTDFEIAITTRARDKLYTISNTDKDQNVALKVGVESGGCHGFQYNLRLADMKKELGEDENILVYQRNDGNPGEYGIAQVIFDENSIQLLQESKIDYTKELIGSQFKVIDSPYTTAGCGCGSSFDFDFEKLLQKKEARSNSD
jgi:iron-sulfur cluster assembly accessory protein